MLVLRSLAPITVEKKPSKKTLAYIKELQATEYYKKVLRNRPLSALTLEENIGRNFAQLSFSPEELNVFSQTPGINLFSGSELTVQDQSVLTYLYDAVIDLRYIKRPSSPLIQLVNKNQMKQVVENYPHDLLALLIPFSLSQSECILWIKENWKDLNQAMQGLESFTPTDLSINLEVGQEIEDLRKQNVRFPKIAVRLEDNHPGDDRFLDYNHVRSIHQKFLKNWQEAEDSINKLRTLIRILKHP